MYKNIRHLTNHRVRDVHENNFSRCQCDKSEDEDDGMKSGNKKKAITCTDCEKALSKDEVALSRKLIDPDTQEFYCLSCMAQNFGCTITDLQDKIREFREAGCTLFL